jgi:DoxX-like family
MTTKTRNIINWVLAGLVAFIFIGSAISKLTANAEALAGAAKFGLSAGTYTILGIIELIAVALFLYPRTGILGTLLLVAYMGGAISTHVEFAQPLMAPIAISAFVWIVAVVRFPELTNRILDNN